MWITSFKSNHQDISINNSWLPWANDYMVSWAKDYNWVCEPKIQNREEIFKTYSCWAKPHGHPHALGVSYLHTDRINFPYLPDNTFLPGTWLISWPYSVFILTKLTCLTDKLPFFNTAIPITKVISFLCLVYSSSLSEHGMYQRPPSNVSGCHKMAGRVSAVMTFGG